MDASVGLRGQNTRGTLFINLCGAQKSFTVFFLVANMLNLKTYLSFVRFLALQSGRAFFLPP